VTACVRCGAAVADGFVCASEARDLAVALLAAAGHAEDAEAVLSRQTRYGAGSRAGSDEPLPVDLTAAAKLGPIETAICGWARIVTEESGRRPRWRVLTGPLCPPTGTACPHDSCGAIRRRSPPPPIALAAAWLSRQTSWLRKHPAAREAFVDLHQACEQLARLVDRPPDKDLVGMCDCGKVLYAERGDAYVRCPAPTCKLRWNVEESREILRKHLGDRLVTLPEAARLAAYLDGDRTQDAIRKLLTARITKLAPHGQIQGEPSYRFGDVVTLLAAIPRRNRERAAA